MFEAFFLVGQEKLYETSWCSKYSVVVNSRELLLHLPSEKHAFKRKNEKKKKTEIENTQNRSLKYKVRGTRYEVWSKEDEKNFKKHWFFFKKTNYFCTVAAKRKTNWNLKRSKSTFEKISAPKRKWLWKTTPVPKRKKVQNEKNTTFKKKNFCT